VNTDKRASLSSGLLGLKDATPATEDGTSSSSAASSDTAKPESRANVLYTKGAASASGFRPSQWSFDGAATAEPMPAPEPEPRLVMPFPAKANTAPPAPPAVPAIVRPALAKKPALAAAAVVAFIALGVAVAAWPRHAGEAPVAALAADLPPSPRPAPAPDATTAGQATALMLRADQLLAIGDIVAARSFYERAAEQGDAAAMTAAGKTYDPLFLEQARVRGSRGDAGKAADWYRRASAAGDAEAEQRLKRLIARYAG
jgi:hypothetical protein